MVYTNVVIFQLPFCSEGFGYWEGIREAREGRVCCIGVTSQAQCTPIFGMWFRLNSIS